jgi:hypothetical protein
MVASGTEAEHHSDLIAVTSDLFQSSANACITDRMSPSEEKFPGGNGLWADGPKDFGDDGL